MDHNYYLMMSYGMAALAILAEIVSLRIGRSQARKHIEEERDLETQD